MPRPSIVYDVLIASPNDALDERKLLSEVVRDWNSAHSKTRGVTLRDLRWELDSSPEDGDAQDIINRKLVDDADVLLGVFRHRLGSPTKENLAGTVEEIARFRAAAKPVLLYFSEVSIPYNHDQEQRQRNSKIKDDGKSNDNFQRLF